MKLHSIKRLMFAACFLALAFVAAAPGAATAQIHIQTIEQLQKIGDNSSYPINGSYVLDNDIDASATRTWNDNGVGGFYGFDPIGDNASKYFSGTLNGNMYVIYNLYINRPTEPNIGLFGFVGGTGLGANGGTIRNVMLDNATIIGSSSTGGLIGTLRKGTVSVCYSKGRVTGTDRVGGFIGDITLYGTVTNCYSTAVVNGASNVGGFAGGIAGTILASSSITNCYSAGSVPGSGINIGGFLGNRGSNVTLTACFWDTETSGTTTGVGSGSQTGTTGKLTDEMMTKSTFTDAGWDFLTVWNLYNRTTYPFFRGPDNAPAAVADSYQTEPDAALIVGWPGVLINDGDADGDSLTAVLVGTAAHGTLVLNDDGSFSYLPDSGFTGTDNFTYRANDGITNSSVTMVTILVIHNHPPVAVADNYATDKDKLLSIKAPGVLKNDNDTDGDSLTAVLVTTTAHGTLVLNEDGSFTYMPKTNYRGTDTFTYKANDGRADSGAATVTIRVGSNEAPVAQSDNYTTPRSTLLEVAAPGVLDNDNDTDHDPLTAVLANTTDHGTLVLSDNGSFTYMPQTGYVGTDTFTYRAYDGYGYSAIATVRITVGSNAVPVVTPDNYTTLEGSPLPVPAPGVLANDTDADHDPLTAVLVRNPAHGTLVFSDNGSFIYDPATGFRGRDTFTYRANDGMANSGVATVTIIVGSNAAPVTTPDNYFVERNDTLEVLPNGVLANDTDADHDPLTAVLVTNTANGSLTFSADGSFTYTPLTDYRGLDSFSYKANDGMADSAVTTVTITVGSNEPPRVVSDNYTTPRNTPLTIDKPGVLGNDSDPDGDNMTAVLVGTTAHGTLVLSDNGSFTYTPDDGFVGIDTFTYRANDGMADSAIATAVIHVGRNAVPQVASDSYKILMNTTLTVAEPGVLANDVDADNDTLTAVLMSTTVHGVLTLSDNGSFTYTPVTGFVGIDTFTYVANDGYADSAVATVSIDVFAPPSGGGGGSGGGAPLAVADSYRTAARTTPLVISAPGVLGNDSGGLTAILEAEPMFGSLALNENGSFIYISTAEHGCTDTFMYSASNGSAKSAAVTVTIIVNAAPSAASDSYSVNPNMPALVVAPGVLANDSDGDGDKLQSELVSAPLNGTFILAADGSFQYTPNWGFIGNDSFTYRAYDGFEYSAPVTVTLSVKFTCPLVAVYGEGSSEVAALRKFRDGVLEKTDAGRAMIKLYYRMAPALEPVMSNNTWLKQAARAVIDRILPVLGRWSK